MYIEIFIFQFRGSYLHLLCWKAPDRQEVFFNYSYTKFVFNFQFEKSLIKHVFLVKNYHGLMQNVLRIATLIE